MKLLLMGDLHLTDKTPSSRTDDFPQTQYDKVVEILELAKKHKVEYIIQPGDFFDHFKTSHFTLQKYIALFKTYNIPILSVFGQHDMRYHSKDIFNTPLQVMCKSFCVSVLGFNPHVPYDKGIVIYGAGWNEEIPDTKNEEGFKILVTHRMVIHKEKLWKDQEHYEKANKLLKDNDFDLIVSGDNHQGFIETYDDALLVNCGSVMRSNIDQITHKPFVVIYDTETRKPFIHYLTIKEDVFDTEKVEKIKEKNEKLESFIEGLTCDSIMNEMNFVKTVNSYSVPDSVRNILNEVFDGLV